MTRGNKVGALLATHRVFDAGISSFCGRPSGSIDPISIRTRSKIEIAVTYSKQTMEVISNRG
jgi:hypothetical protein